MNTPRIELTPFTITHARNRNYVMWLNDAQVLRYLGRPDYHHGVTLRDCERYFEDLTTDRNVSFFAVVLDGDRFVGTGKLRKVVTAGSDTGVVDVGLMVGDRSCWGLGIGSRVISLLSDHAFQSWSSRKLVAGMYAGNQACVRAFLKGGFHIEGQLQAHIWDPKLEQFDDLVLMGRFSDRSRTIHLKSHTEPRTDQ